MDARTLQNDVDKQDRLPNRPGGGSEKTLVAHFFEFWTILGPKMVSTWRPRRSKNAINKDTKSIDFLKPLGKPTFRKIKGFWKPKWKEVGIKIRPTVDLSLKS